MADNIPEQEQPPAPAAAPVEPAITAKPIDEDPKTDMLVDEIQRSNSDAELEAAFVPETPAPKRNWRRKYLDNKKWTIPLTVLVVLLIALFAVPVTRYKVLGLVIKKTFIITVDDATTGTPVSKAKVSLGTNSVMTDAAGQAVFKNLPVGSLQATISKQYYRTTTMKAFVGLKSSHNSQKLLLQATGRQVSITVTNKITGDPITSAEITALGTSAKTDKTGSAVLVLPADHKTASATITADGYNEVTGAVQITTDVVAANSFALVPSGRAYFLSNASGKVDVISANYDGSDRQTLLAGTGYENNAAVQLIPSPDQKNLALIARRTNVSNAVGLYNIATATGKMTTAEADAHQDIAVVGWSDNNFVYFTQNYDAQSWQPGQEALKSYSAANVTATTLDQTDASGTNYNDALYEQLNRSAAIIDGTVVYAKSWSAGSLSVSQLASKTNGIYSVQPNGASKKTLKALTIPASSYYSYVGQVMASPHLEYFASPTTSSNDYSQGALFFKYTKGTLSQLNNFTADDFNNPDLKGYVATSPSGNKLLYSDTVDGQTVVSVSDDAGGAKQKLVTLHGAASVQGWLTDDYILVSQDNSQLYVISANSSAQKAQPLSLASFFTPPPSQQSGH